MTMLQCTSKSYHLTGYWKNWQIVQQTGHLCRLEIVVADCGTWNWMAPKKLAPSDKFVVIFQVAQNPLKFAMSILFVLKNVRVFLSRRQRNMDKIAWKSNPPPPSLCPSPNNVGFRSLRAKHCLCVVYYWRGGGGDARLGVGVWWTFKNMFEALFPCLWEIRTWTKTFFHRKRVGMANFSGFWATWKITTNLTLGASFFGPLQLVFWQSFLLYHALGDLVCFELWLLP